MSTVRASPLSVPYRRPSRWPDFWDFVKYMAWEVGTKAILGLIYLQVISEGLRIVVPALGQKLWRVPGLSMLRDFEETHKLDLAPFFAMFLLLAVFMLWKRVIVLWMLSKKWEQFSQEERLVVVLGGVILGADGLLFYFAMTQMGWGGSFSITASLATCAYVGVLIFVSWVSVNLNPGNKE